MPPNKEPISEVKVDQPEVIGFPLTKEFLEFVFEKQVERFEVTLGTNPGDNYLSIMHAVEVVFKGESESNYYLIKCYPNHSARREFLDEVNVFEKELFMYDTFLPLLKQTAKESGADENMVSLALPPFHGGNVVISPSKKFKGTQWEGENFLVMTDLRHANFTMADRTEGLNLDHAVLVLKEMAKLHALSWAYKEKNQLDMLSSKYPRLLDDMYNNEKLSDQMKDLMGKVTENALSVVKDGLGAEHPGYLGLKRVAGNDTMVPLRKFMRPQGRNEDEFEEMLRVRPEDKKDYNKEQWLTGTHGDCWVNNLLFRYDDSEGRTKPANLIFVDFQIYREACPTVDIAYFFSSSVRAPVRNAHKDELLKAYYGSFLMTCNELNVSPYPGFSFTNLKRRFRRSEIFGLLVALPLLSVVLKPPEESIDMDKSEGTDAMELFSEVLEGSDKNTKFQAELVATVLDLYENGVL